MLTFSSLQINAWIAFFFWPFFRVLAVVGVAPFFGARGIPISAKVVFAFFLTVLIAPLLPPMPVVEPASPQGLLLLVQQLLIGLGMGFAVRVAFSAMEMAGHIAGLQMGLGFASFFDPQNSAQIPLIGQLMGIMAMLLFLSLNGHLMVIAALVASFEQLPVGGTLDVNGWKMLVLFGGNIFTWGLVMSLPVVAALMLVNAALAVLSRAAPQLNIYALGFTITLLVGFVVLIWSLPYVLPLFNNMLEISVQVMGKFARLAP